MDLTGEILPLLVGAAMGLLLLKMLGRNADAAERPSSSQDVAWALRRVRWRRVPYLLSTLAAWQRNAALEVLAKFGVDRDLECVLRKSGWPVDLQILAVAARLSEAEIRVRLNSGSRPDPEALRVLAALHGYQSGADGLMAVTV